MITCFMQSNRTHQFPFVHFQKAMSNHFQNSIMHYLHSPILQLQNLPTMGRSEIHNYFINMKVIADTLEIIAQKTLTKTPFTSSELSFLCGMIIPPGSMCGDPYTGWYPSLFYRGEDDAFKNDLIIADIHTSKSDEDGNPVGWVLHVGTGPLDMAIITAETPDGQFAAFVGPVLSYYEHLTTGLKRLTDEEWKTLYNVAPSLRPAFVNLYLADTTGASKGEALSLATGVDDKSVPQQQPVSFEVWQSYPNPFNSTAIISFTIPPSLAYSMAEVKIVNLQGQVVRNIFKQALPAGNYSVRWDGNTEKGVSAASGVYFYNVSVGALRHTGKMVLVR